MSTKLLMGTTPVAGRGRRSWPEALKREIVAASCAPGASVSMVARRYDVNANQVFSWRKHYHSRDTLAAGTAMVATPAPVLVPVMITAEPDCGVSSAPGPEPSLPFAPPALPVLIAAPIEIDLGLRYRLRVGAGFDGDALVRVLDILERR